MEEVRQICSNQPVKAVVLTGSSLRHRYFAEVLSKHLNVVLVLSELRKNYYTKQREESADVRMHFDSIAEAEHACLGQPDDKALADRWETVENINDSRWLAKAKEAGAEVACLFGTGILKDGWLDGFENRVINLHLGLSPFYRGSATLFWPFFCRQVECLGTTIHLAVPRVDAGPILKRIKPHIFEHENYYRITNKLIKKSIDSFPETVLDYLAGRIEPKPQEQVEGKVFRKCDFTDEALFDVLNYVGDGFSRDELARIKRSEKCRC